MTLQDTDFFLVNRNQESYKMAASALSDYLDSGASVHVGENPPADTPEQGDLWWKSDVGILYVYYVDENTSQWVQAAGSVGGNDDGGGASVQVGESFEGTPQAGDLWWDSSDDSGRLYVWYVDDNSSQWVEASPSGGGGEGGGIPEAPTDGQQYARQNSNWSVVQSGDVIYQGAAAWGKVARDGSLTAGLNIASSGPNGTGRYDIVFANPMPSADYAVTLGFDETNGTGVALKAESQTANGFSVYCFSDPASANVANSAFGFAVHALNALPPRGGTGADAWGTFDGLGVAVGSLFNCTTSRTGAGTYMVTFNTPMPSNTYAVNCTAPSGLAMWLNTKTVNGFEIQTINSSNGVPNDFSGASFVVHATNAQLPNTITEDQIAALIQNPVLSAWGSSDSNGNVLKSFNINRIDKINAGSGVYDIFFENDMPDASYAVTATAALYNCLVFQKLPGSFRVQTFDSAGAQADASFDFHVAGTARNGTLGGGADAWASTSGAAVLQGGYNLSVVGDGGGIFTYTFDNPMPNGNYSVVATPTNSIFATSRVFNKTPTQFGVLFQDVTPATQGNVLGADHCVAVFATDGNAGGFWVKDGEGASEVLKPLNDDATIEASALTDGTTTKTMTEVLAGGGGAGTLQEVTDLGNTTTNAIIGSNQIGTNREDLANALFVNGTTGSTRTTFAIRGDGQLTIDDSDATGISPKTTLSPDGTGTLDRISLPRVRTAGGANNTSQISIGDDSQSSGIGLYSGDTASFVTITAPATSNTSSLLVRTDEAGDGTLVSKFIVRDTGTVQIGGDLTDFGLTNTVLYTDGQISCAGGMLQLFDNYENTLWAGVAANTKGLQLGGNAGAIGFNSLSTTTSTGAPIHLFTESGVLRLYQVTSLRSAKTNIVSLPTVWDKVKALNPTSFNGVGEHDKDVNSYGFIAEEVDEVDSHFGVHDEEGLKGVNYNALTAVLTAALKEAMTRIETLESRLTALEGGN